MNTHSKGEIPRRIHQTNLGCLKRERIGILFVVRGESSIREIRTLSYVSSGCSWLVGLQVIFCLFCPLAFSKFSTMNMYDYFVSFFNVISKGKNICFEPKILSEGQNKIKRLLKIHFQKQSY